MELGPLLNDREDLARNIHLIEAKEQEAVSIQVLKGL